MIAPLYAKVLEQAARELGPGAAYAALWPYEALPPPWNLVLERLYQEVAALPVVPTTVGGSGNRWLRPDQLLYLDDAVSKCASETLKFLKLNAV